MATAWPLIPWAQVLLIGCCAVAPLPVPSRKNGEVGEQSSKLQVPEGRPVGPPPSKNVPPSVETPAAEDVIGSARTTSSCPSSFVVAANRESPAGGELHPNAKHPKSGSPARSATPENA